MLLSYCFLTSTSRKLTNHPNAICISQAIALWLGGLFWHPVKTYYYQVPSSRFQVLTTVWMVFLQTVLSLFWVLVIHGFMISLIVSIHLVPGHPLLPSTLPGIMVFSNVLLKNVVQYSLKDLIKSGIYKHGKMYITAKNSTNSQ